MFKSATLSFIIPKISSKTKTQAPKVAPISWSQARNQSKRNLALSGNIAPILAVGLIAGMAGFMVMHLFWINTYSSKGVELKKVQTEIAAQTEIQKKLLVKQSLLNSSVSLNDLEKTNLVPVTDAESISGSTLAQIK